MSVSEPVLVVASEPSPESGSEPGSEPGSDPARADAVLVAAIRAALTPHADPVRAAAQQAYMKSSLPYLGIPKPVLTSVLRSPLTSHVVRDRGVWAATVRDLVATATHREEWYAALALAGHRRYRTWACEPEALELYQWVVARTQWWDVVDEVAAHRVGSVLAEYRESVTPVLRTWAVDGTDLWLRRTAILSQLRSGGDTDAALLSDVLVANLSGSAFGETFWIRKAIGWALRSHAATDPDWVRAFVETHGGMLSGLSRREALKHL